MQEVQLWLCLIKASEKRGRGIRVGRGWGKAALRASVMPQAVLTCKSSGHGRTSAPTCQTLV